MKKPYIICAAIWFDDGIEHVHQPKNIDTGFVITGRRHHNCFQSVAILTNRSDSFKKMDNIQGFLTSDDMFVGREIAANIAYLAGQLQKPTETLYSEDIY